MISFSDTYELIQKEYCIFLNNHSNTNIVFFGNCQVVPIAYYLNSITKNYNIYIILSWIFFKEGFEKYNMIDVNNKLQTIIKNCDALIYHTHNTDYGVYANDILNNIPKKSMKINIPNLQLHFVCDNSDKFWLSLNILKLSIKNSDLNNFIFIGNNYNKIRFFNTNEHPTHFIMYLMALDIYYKITKSTKKIKIMDYFSEELRENFYKIKEHVILPGKEELNDEITRLTGISKDVDYFDI